jgi:hypothetical protein
LTLDAERDDDEVAMEMARRWILLGIVILSSYMECLIMIQRVMGVCDGL